MNKDLIIPIENLKINIASKVYYANGNCKVVVNSESNFEVIWVKLKNAQVSSSGVKTELLPNQIDNFANEIKKYPQFVWFCSTYIKSQNAIISSEEVAENKEIPFVITEVMEDVKTEPLDVRIKNFAKLAFQMMNMQNAIPMEDIAIMWKAYLKNNFISYNERRFEFFIDDINSDGLCKSEDSVLFLCKDFLNS